MSTHTEGPWERQWSWNGFDIVADGPPIARVHFGHDMESAIANSHLISAAPDLLAAGIEIRNVLGRLVMAVIMGDKVGEEMEAAVNKAQDAMNAAIARAEGKGQAA